MGGELQVVLMLKGGIGISLVNKDPGEELDVGIRRGPRLRCFHPWVLSPSHGSPVVCVHPIFVKRDGWVSWNRDCHWMVRTRGCQALCWRPRNATSATHRHVPLLSGLWSIRLVDGLLKWEQTPLFKIDIID